MHLMMLDEKIKMNVNVPKIREHPTINTHLLSDDDQRVSIFREKVKDAPDLEGIITRDA